MYFWTLKKMTSDLKHIPKTMFHRGIQKFYDPTNWHIELGGSYVKD